MFKVYQNSISIKRLSMVKTKSGLNLNFRTDKNSDISQYC